MGDRVVDALERLGRFVTELTIEDVPEPVRDRLALVLYDHLGVTVAGARTQEGRRLVSCTDAPDGPAPVIGAGRGAPVESAAWLNGTAACSLELDEGNKYARGHPAAHAFPAALAVAAARATSGDELAVALLVGYEVAARFGAATVLHRGVHPHGNWGVTGAAAAASSLLRADARTTATALDAATGLVLATPFLTVLEGNTVRNAWMGNANVSGVHAARMAQAGLAVVDGTPRATLGSLLGELDAEVLDDGLGESWLIERGYFKRHASCSYTHPPADAVIELRGSHPELAPADVEAVTVETHHLAAGLDRTEVSTRLAAMFSIPYVVAVALLNGDCAPRRFDEDARQDDDIRTLAAKVEVAVADDLDRRLPDERAARVTVRLRSGDELTTSAPNPIGDADHHPFGWAEVRDKLEALIEPVGADAVALEKSVGDLLGADDVTSAVQGLP